MSTTREARQEQQALARHLVDGMLDRPRNRQRRIGPSGMGNPCRYCYARTIAELPVAEHSLSWLAEIGTAVHAVFEEIMSRHPRDKYRTEQVVTVGNLRGTPVTGSIDLTVYGIGKDDSAVMTVDYKIVGESTLRKVKKDGVSQQYLTQAMLYGKGLEDAGHNVTHVCIWFLPRNRLDMKYGIVRIIPYDRSIAVQALRRANKVAAYIDGLDDDELFEWLNVQPSHPDCFTCKKNNRI